MKINHLKVFVVLSLMLVFGCSSKEEQKSEVRFVDLQGNAIVAYTFQTAFIPSSTVPPGEQAWYTWFVPTGATNGQQYQTIKYGNNTNPPGTSIPNIIYIYI